MVRGIPACAQSTQPPGMHDCRGKREGSSRSAGLSIPEWHTPGLASIGPFFNARPHRLMQQAGCNIIQHCAPRTPRHQWHSSIQAHLQYDASARLHRAQRRRPTAALPQWAQRCGSCAPASAAACTAAPAAFRREARCARRCVPVRGRSLLCSAGPMLCSCAWALGSSCRATAIAPPSVCFRGCVRARYAVGEVLQLQVGW